MSSLSCIHVYCVDHFLPFPESVTIRLILPSNIKKRYSYLLKKHYLSFYQTCNFLSMLIMDASPVLSLQLFVHFIIVQVFFAT